MNLIVFTILLAKVPMPKAWYVGFSFFASVLCFATLLYGYLNGFMYAAGRDAEGNYRRIYKNDDPARYLRIFVGLSIAGIAMLAVAVLLAIELPNGWHG